MILKKTTQNKQVKIQKKHNEIGYEILIKEGYPKLAEISFNHTIPNMFKIDDLEIWNKLNIENKIVCFSDMHVLQNDLVSLEKRFKYLLSRYPNKERLVKLLELHKTLEPEILELANIPNNINFEKILESSYFNEMKNYFQKID
jgi:hypothetical protein